jgi:hypothetical protein
MKTQGEMEAAICEGINRFEQEYMGRGPKDLHAHLIGDLLLVRLLGVLTAAEQHLVKTLPPEKGRDLLKQVRTQSDRDGEAGDGSDGSGGYRRQGLEPAPRYQHAHRRRAHCVHLGQVARFPRVQEEMKGVAAFGLATHDGANRAEEYSLQESFSSRCMRDAASGSFF